MYRHELATINAFLEANIGKDLTSELNNATYRTSLEFILNHHKIGRYAPNISEEKVVICSVQKLSQSYGLWFNHVDF